LNWWRRGDEWGKRLGGGEDGAEPVRKQTGVESVMRRKLDKLEMEERVYEGRYPEDKFESFNSHC
jgi:hypothetical protein